MKELLKDLEKVNLLTRDEEFELCKKAADGDRKAINTLVESNMRFVISVAMEYRDCGLEMDDLVDEGAAGLVIAAQKFNPDRNTRFITYGVFWVRATIEKAIRETSKGVRFPGNRYKEMKDDFWNFASLDKSIRGEEGEVASLHNFIPDTADGPSEIVEKKMMTELLYRKLNKLKPVSRKVLVLRYGLNDGKERSLSEVGEILGYCKERIRQIEGKAINEMRAFMDGNGESASLAA